ncbi:MAG: single-stranded DNA-binding protein [Lachnospiraceae bacterium]|nr:single-stranded DNA-binding protein [Lachnospiraceae bacterium]
MEKEQITTNTAAITGVLTEPVTFSHEYMGGYFYKSVIEADRRSEEHDLIPVIFPGKALRGRNVTKGSAVTIRGQFRSRNTPGPDRMKLMLYFYATDVEEEPPVDDDVVCESPASYCGSEHNSVFLDGYLCREPGYRITPRGRDITDMILAVNRKTNRTDYIPCIAWGKNALLAKEMRVGDRIALNGRIQSRVYRKTDPEGSEREMTAYEVSVMSMRREEPAQAGA